MKDIEQAWYRATMDALRRAFQMLELEDGMTVNIDWPNQTTKIRYQLRLGILNPDLTPVQRRWAPVAWSGTLLSAREDMNWICKIWVNSDRRNRTFTQNRGPRSTDEGTFLLKHDGEPMFWLHVLDHLHQEPVGECRYEVLGLTGVK